MKTAQKLAELRKVMEKEGIDACLVLSCDANQSEYVAEHWKERAWITGFTGSAGTAVITRSDAGLWTDGRYFIQAESQLKDSGIRLFKIAEPGYPSYEEWIAGVLPEGGCLAVDGRTLSVSAMKALKKTITKNVTIRTDIDAVGKVWSDRPCIPADKVFLHDEKYAGKSCRQKLDEVRKSMKKLGADYYLLCALDEICWLYNIRGNDIPYNPYVTSYAVIGEKDAFLFADKNKVPEAVSDALSKSGVSVKGIDEIYSFLKGIESGATVVYDPDKVSVSLVGSIADSARKIESEGIVTPIKAVKNDVEIENIRDCYIKDSVALVKLFKWLKENVASQKITEMDADAKGLEFRKELPLFVELSFDTISAYGDHAAMMHYAPTPEKQYTLKNSGFYLIDSGSHFLNGTTDITRTIALGELSDEQKRDFTLTLKSVIALSTSRFLYGATGSNLDYIPRKVMWDNGLDYKCGSGHSVGYFSNVHEEGGRFSKQPNNFKLEKGMTITIEPGVYKEGRHGIRTENTLLIVADTETEFGTFLKFENLTYLPIDRSAIVPAMLTPFEKDWINNYHKQVFEKLSPYLDEAHKSWLKKETEPVALEAVRGINL